MKRIAGTLFLAALATTVTGCAFDAEPPEDARIEDQWDPDVPEFWHQDPIDQEVLCAGVDSCQDMAASWCVAANAGRCYSCCDNSPWGIYLTTRCCPTDIIEPDVFDIPPDACDVDDGCVAPDPGPDVDPPLDVVPDDSLPDCGPTVCYDCHCDCGAGSDRPYGGCFNDCNPVPDYIANCSLDCTGMCDFEPGVQCGPSSGWQECGDGQECIEVPCPLCGVQPPSYCVLPHCTGFGCYRDGDCDGELACYQADIPAGVQGVCLPSPIDEARCWVDAECPAGSTCQDAAHCDPCSPCRMVEHPGQCVASQALDAVVLWLGTSMAAPGSTLVPRWFNFTDGAVYLPGCSTYSIQRMHQDDEWVDLGEPVACAWEGIAVKLEPGDAHAAFPFEPPLSGGERWTDNFRVRGDYWVGCGDELPISGAACTGGPYEVLSDAVFIGAAP